LFVGPALRWRTRDTPWRHGLDIGLAAFFPGEMFDIGLAAFFPGEMFDAPANPPGTRMAAPTSSPSNRSIQARSRAFFCMSWIFGSRVCQTSFICSRVTTLFVSLTSTGASFLRVSAALALSFFS
jgi:hypothetical protein